MGKATKIVIAVLVAAIVVVGGLAVAKAFAPPAEGPTASEIDPNDLPEDVAIDVVEPGAADAA